MAGHSNKFTSHGVVRFKVIVLLPRATAAVRGPCVLGALD